MSLLEDIEVFGAVVRQGGFSRAAKSLGLSNGLVSRRIAQLEQKLGVALIIRTTRQLHLTPEGELLWEHAQRIQQEMTAALNLIQSRVEKPTGKIRISAPIYYGKHRLVPLILQFMKSFTDISVDLFVTNQRLDPHKENLDILIRGAGYTEKQLAESNMKMTLLLKQRVDLYASPEYLVQYGEPSRPEDLLNHRVIGYIETAQPQETETWRYSYKNKQESILLHPFFNCNDLDSRIMATVNGIGISKLPGLMITPDVRPKLKPILTDYHWGDFSLYAMYAQQSALPKRTRLLLDFIISNIRKIDGKI